MAAVALALALAGCGGNEKPVGTIGHVKGFAGAVVADEPRAVQVARDVLSAGGTAADAAVSLYFSLAVTLPSTASLGGGGVCVVFDVARKSAEVLDFQAPAGTAPSGTAVAVPSNPRGFFALHAKYGKLRWESLLAEPERMAREGIWVSRALANDLAQAAPLLAADPEARKLFFRPDGRVLGEGDRLRSHDLAAILAWLRRAPGEMYVGQLAHGVAAAARGAGVALMYEDMRDVRPRFVSGVVTAVGDDKAVLSAAGSGAGAPPGTGFAVVDSLGGGVACAVSANGLFGIGRVAPGTGIVLAAAPSGAQPVAAGLVVNENAKEIHFAGAAGGVSAVPALAKVLHTVAADKTAPDKVIEAADPAGDTKVNAIACAGPTETGQCQAAVDPRGFGYGVLAGKD